MFISDNGLKILTLREGKRNKAYLDTKGIWTIGVGHTGPEVKAGLVWTDQQIEETLRKDIKTSELCINTSTLVPLTQNQFDALVSFVFNVGVNAFKRSTMLKFINLKQFTKAMLEFNRWHIPPEITSRRNSERDQFNTGI